MHSGKIDICHLFCYRENGGHLFSEKNTAKSVPRSNRWLHVTLNFVEIFLFSSLPMETGHLDMCDSLFWPFR